MTDFSDHPKPDPSDYPRDGLLICAPMRKGHYNEWLHTLAKAKTELTRRLIDLETQRLAYDPVPPRSEPWPDETPELWQHRKRQYQLAAKFGYPLNAASTFSLKS